MAAFPVGSQSRSSDWHKLAQPPLSSLLSAETRYGPKRHTMKGLAGHTLHLNITPSPVFMVGNAGFIGAYVVLKD